jgi:hypothetical protein
VSVAAADIDRQEGDLFILLRDHELSIVRRSLSPFTQRRDNGPVTIEEVFTLPKSDWNAFSITGAGRELATMEQGEDDLWLITVEQRTGEGNPVQKATFRQVEGSWRFELIRLTSVIAFQSLRGLPRHEGFLEVPIEAECEGVVREQQENRCQD